MSEEEFSVPGTIPGQDQVDDLESRDSKDPGRIAMHQHPTLSRSIFSCYRACIKGFSELGEALRNETALNGLSSSEQQQQIQKVLREELGRFRIWAGNGGAHHKADSKMSLDYRLRESLHVHGQVTQLLEDLENSLGEGRLGLLHVTHCYSR